MSHRLLVLLTVPVIACNPGRVGFDDGDGDETVATDTTALEAQVAALSESLTDAVERIDDLESALAEDRNELANLGVAMEQAQADIDELQAGAGAEGGGDDSGGGDGGLDQETLDALVEAVADLEDNAPTAWSTTGSSAGESSSWTVLATDTITLPADGPVIAWCSAAYSGVSGQLKLTLHTETVSYSSSTLSGSSVSTLFSSASAGVWTLECSGLGGPWAIGTMVAVQVPNHGS